MLEVAKKLLMARELSFDEGKITMLRGRVVIISAATFVKMHKLLAEKGLDSDSIMYEWGKYIGYHWTSLIKQRYSMNTNDMFKWSMNTLVLGGWGKMEIVKVDLEKKDYAVYRAYDSPFTSELGRTGKKVDSLIAGFYAGGGSVIYDKSLKCEETKCRSVGDPYCEFVVVPSDDDWYEKWKANEKNQKI